MLVLPELKSTGLSTSSSRTSSLMFSLGSCTLAFVQGVGMSWNVFITPSWKSSVDFGVYVARDEPEMKNLVPFYSVY